MQIFIGKDGRQLGPFDEDAVRAGLRDGSFLPTDLAWYEGAASWMPLHTMPGLVAAPPVPVGPTQPAAVKSASKFPPIIYKLIYGFTTAVTILIAVLRFLPSSTSVNDRGIAHAKKGEYDLAIGDYTEAIKRWGGKDYLYYNRSLSYKRKKEYDKAIADLAEALRLNPKYADAYAVRGDIYEEKKDHEKALADYDQAIALNPNKASSYYDRGLVHQRMHNYDKALADYDESIRRDSKFASAYINRGIVQQRKGDREKAISDYTEAIRLNSKNAKSYYNRALAYNEKHDYERAIPDFEQATQLDPQDPDAPENLAWLLAVGPQAHLRNGGRAVTFATKACELSEWKGSVLSTLAAAYAEAGDFDQAIKWQSKYVSTVSERDKANAEARLALYEKRKPYHMAM
jgi:tetratricopeptide (TPR) repeat protein